MFGDVKFGFFLYLFELSIVVSFPLLYVLERHVHIGLLTRKHKFKHTFFAVIVVKD